jgi:hypothetical protein
MHVNQPIGGAADDNHRGHRPEHKYGYYGHDPLLRFPTVEQRIVLALVPVSQREKPQSRAVTRIAALRNESLNVRPRLLLGSGFSGRVSSAGIGQPVSRATVDVHPPFVGEFLRLISFRAMEWDRRTISKL